MASCCNQPSNRNLREAPGSGRVGCDVKYMNKVCLAPSKEQGPDHDWITGWIPFAIKARAHGLGVCAPSLRQRCIVHAVAHLVGHLHMLFRDLLFQLNLSF